MPTWVALFRGINVGGRNRLPMAELKHLFEDNQCQNVRTYIQSGNVVFDARSKSKSKLTKLLLDAVELEFSFRPKLFLLRADEFRAAKDDNPFPAAVAKPKTLHLFFLESIPNATASAGLADLAAKTETYQLNDRVLYLHAPEGFADSKLAKNAERQLGVTVTARNYATIEKLASMLADS